MLPRPELFKWMWFNVSLQTQLLLAIKIFQDQQRHFIAIDCTIAPKSPSQRKKIENQIPTDILYLWTVCLNCVMNVDQNQENCHQKSHPARDYLRVHQETMVIKQIITFDSHKKSSLTWSTRRPQRVPRGDNMSRCRMTFSASGEAGSLWCCNSSLGRKH